MTFCGNVHIAKLPSDRRMRERGRSKNKSTDCSIYNSFMKE